MYNFLQSIPIEIYSVLLGGTLTIISLYIGFYLWKKQIKTQKQYESALQFIEALIKYHESIKYVRSAWMPISEYGPHMDESSNGYFKGISYAYEKRWEKITNSRIHLADKKIIFELSTGLDLTSNIRSLYEKQGELLANIQTYIDGLRGNRNPLYNNTIIWGISDDNDTFDQEIKSQVEQIKTILKTYLLQ